MKRSIEERKGWQNYYGYVLCLLIEASMTKMVTATYMKDGSPRCGKQISLVRD